MNVVERHLREVGHNATSDIELVDDIILEPLGLQLKSRSGFDVMFYKYARQGLSVLVIPRPR